MVWCLQTVRCVAARQKDTEKGMKQEEKIYVTRSGLFARPRALGGTTGHCGVLLQPTTDGSSRMAPQHEKPPGVLPAFCVEHFCSELHEPCRCWWREPRSTPEEKATAVIIICGSDSDPTHVHDAAAVHVLLCGFAAAEVQLVWSVVLWLAH